NRRIVRYSPMGHFVGNYGTQGAGALAHPNGVCVDGLGRVYVADGILRSIAQYEPTGQLIRFINGAGPDRLLNPMAVAVNEDGVLYAVDHQECGKVVMFRANGSVVGRFGDKRGTPGALSRPYGIDFDRAGRVYIADTMHRRIAVFTAGGEYVKELPVPYVKAEPHVFRPYDVAVDDPAVVFASDCPGNRIWVLSDNGDILSYFGEQGAYEGQFYGPAGICLHPDGSLLVTDIYNHRIQIFPSLPADRLRVLTFWSWLAGYRVHLAVTAGAVALLVILWLVLRRNQYRALYILDHRLLERPGTTWGQALALAVAAIGAAGAQMLAAGRGPPWRIFALYAVSVPAFIKGTRGRLSPRYLERADDAAATIRRLWPRIVTGSAALAAAGGSVWLHRDFYLRNEYSHWAYILWLTAVAGWWFTWDRRPSASRRTDHWKTWVIPVLVLAAALGMRLYRIHELPVGLDNDEGIHGFTVLQLMREHEIKPFVPDAYGVETLHFYIMAMLFKVLGSGVVSMRLASVLTAMAGIMAIFVFLRRQFDARTGLMGAGFMALSFWHLVYSRVALRVIAALPWAILTLHFLLRRRGRTRDMLLAGICMGLGLFSYSPIRTLPLIVAPLFLLPLLKKRFTGLLDGALFYSTAALAGLPMLMYAVYRTMIWTGRTQALIVRGVFPHTIREAALRTWDSLLQFYRLLPRNYTGISFSDAVNGSMQTTTILMGVVIPAFFTLGLAYYLCRMHRSFHFIHLFWFAAAMAPSVLFGPNASRQIMAMPVVFILAGTAAGVMWNTLLGAHPGAARKTIVSAMAVLLLGVVGYEGYATYFRHYSAQPALRAYYCEVATAMGDETRRLAPEGHVVVVQNTCFDTTRFLLEELGDRAEQILIHPLSRDRVVEEVMNRMRRSELREMPLFFILETNNLVTQMKRAVIQECPAAEFEGRPSPSQPGIIMYEVGRIPPRTQREVP
ncbi:glycosyltransferase family 39 protein, partial [bacterium]|nr:glycosyltransferase family 39 protein [candidate division CSSED10-310 bacterium]